MSGSFKRFLESALPARPYALLLSAYHFMLAQGAALWWGSPAKKLFVIGITGTKGKSSTAEMVAAILENAGFRVALASTIHFKIDKEFSPNLFKMTMPGRGYLQRFLARAKQQDCTHAVIEITSEGARQFRHVGLALDALIFTNIAPEHIESHGSFENYKNAKLAIGKALVRSGKRPRFIVADPEDELGKIFLELPVENRLPFSLKDAGAFKTEDTKAAMTFEGVSFSVPFPGTFTVKNALAAATLARSLGIEPKIIARALSTMSPIRGRAERIDCGQDFLVIVDYAHTPGSLTALYSAFPEKRKICVLGNTGGGRDHWKRREMGAIADKECAVVILTNEDPYDEDPREIVGAMAEGMKKKPLIIMDRREALRKALSEAHEGDAVLITGKGTDPFIMGPQGTKTPWSDAAVTTEELRKLMQKRNLEPRN